MSSNKLLGHFYGQELSSPNPVETSDVLRFMKVCLNPWELKERKECYFSK